MSGGLGRSLRLGAAFIYSFYTNDWSVFAAQAVGERQRVQADKARRRGIEAYNDSLKDRLEMTDVQPRQARTAVLGRARCVEGVRRRWTSGENQEKLTMIVSFAGHQIDAFEAWYLDDTLVTLDANGWVQMAPWKRITADPTQEQQATLDGAGAATLTLASVPIPGSVTAVWSTGSGENVVSGPLTFGVSGSVVTVSGGQPLATAIVNYSTSVAQSFVRIRPYLGTSTQSVGGDLAAEYPGELTSTDHFRGIALAVVDVLYDPDIFPQGRPTVTAVVRGARVLDPRDGVTRWTENPALHAYWYATWQHGWNVPASEVRTADVIAAANVCDASVTYTLRKNGELNGYALPRYRCGVVLSTEADPRQNMQDVLDTMAGRIGWSGGQIRMRAGHMPTPVAHITQDWIVQPVGEGADEPVISAAQSYTRAQRINRVTGSCVDPDQRYQVLPYPAVQDSVLIAAKGERQQEIDYAGANHIAHAQNLARIAIREAQAGLRLEMLCGLQAWKLELGDVTQVTLPRHGISAKTFEVTGWRWSAESAVALQLQEITEAIFDPLAELTGRDPAPDSTLRRPWDVEGLGGLAVTSGTTPTLDGSVLTRTTVTWSPAVGASIRQGGQIEVQYVQVGAMPADGADWPSWLEAGTSTRAIIPGLLAGRFYLFRVRAVQPLPLVRGVWTQPVLHQLAGVRVPRIYRQAAAPTTGLITGDEWYDTDDGNKHYVREGGAWVSVRDAGIADALAAAAAAQATADGKIDTFWQATAPASASEGDLWFDTDDGGKQYRWTSGAWVLAADARIGQAISDAADAQATADGKVRTYVQTSAPTAEAVGDLWIDSDGGNAMYRWSGSAWASVRDGGITDALSAAAAAQATADGKIDSFWQATPPGSASEGDLWFDTDDGGKQYRWTSGAWVLAADARIGQAISDAADAQATADGKVRTYVQTSAPTAEAVGDLWIDSDGGNAMYRWSGSAWASVRDGGITDALSAAAAAQATADGKIDSFWQATPPGSASEGDLWFDTDDGGKQYRWTSGAWVLAADARIGQAISDAADAQATADGKVTTFVQASAPTAEAVGDLWLDSDDGNKLYRWSGSAWVALPVGTGGIAPNAATEVYSVTPGSAVTVTQTSFTPDNFIRNTQIVQVTFTPSADGVAAIFFEGRGEYTNSTAFTASTSWSIQDVGGAWDSWRKLQQSVPASGTAQFPMQTTRRISVTGGVTYTVAVYANKLNSGDTLTVDRTELRVEVIKR